MYLSKEPVSEVWSSPEKLNYLNEVILEKLCVEEHIRASIVYGFGSDRPVYINKSELSARDAVISVNNRIVSIVERLKDPYLAYGVATLSFYDTWQKFGKFLMTPEEQRRPIDHHWGDLWSACGSVCLAARFSGQEIMIDFNDDVLSARPDTFPAALAEDYLGPIIRSRVSTV